MVGLVIDQSHSVVSTHYRRYSYQTGNSRASYPYYKWAWSRDLENTKRNIECYRQIGGAWSVWSSPKVNQSSKLTTDVIRTKLVNPELVTGVIKRLNDEDSDVRRAAVDVIGKMAEYGQFSRRSKSHSFV
jgi:hypothetical protein